MGAMAALLCVQCMAPAQAAEEHNRIEEQEVPRQLYECHLEMTRSAPPPEKAEPEAPPTRYSAIAETISQEERQLLALVVYHESRGEPEEGQEAVCEVVLNRVLSDKFPNSISQVIYQKEPLQFACSPYLTTAAIHEPEALERAEQVVEQVLTADTYQTAETTLFFSTGKPNRDCLQIEHHYFY